MGQGKNKGGRPKKTETQKAIDKMNRILRKRAKKEGKDLDDILMDLLYDPIAAPKDRLAAIRLFKDFTMTKASESTVKVTDDRGPGVLLPEMMDDPALMVIEGGKE